MNLEKFGKNKTLKMKNYNELILAINNNIQLVWNDPEHIEGNDYTIKFIDEITDEHDDYSPILIHYGEGSEAQVYLHEITYKP